MSGGARVLMCDGRQYSELRLEVESDVMTSYTYKWALPQQNMCDR